MIQFTCSSFPGDDSVVVTYFASNASSRAPCTWNFTVNSRVVCAIYSNAPSVSSGLSAGGIAGIVVAIVLVIVMIIIVVLFNRNRPSSSTFYQQHWPEDNGVPLQSS